MNINSKPSQPIDIKSTFGINCRFNVFAFNSPEEYVPQIDQDYCFEPETTLAILSGFSSNRRVLIQGMHGTGKSSHIEQVAARLNWPCMRINLDGHLNRLDLTGKDTITIKDGLQVTEFKEGILLQCIQKPIALILDEYDAGRPDVMFIIQQLLEQNGKYTSLETNQVITPHPYFRLFATCNTLGLGNLSGLYSGTQILNHSQLDRWNMIATLNYLKPEHEESIILSKHPELNNETGKYLVKQMIGVANLTRNGFISGDISTVMSPRTVLTWAENFHLLTDIKHAFKLSFMNRCEYEEKEIINEYYFRCFGEYIEISDVANVD